MIENLYKVAELTQSLYQTFCKKLLILVNEGLSIAHG